MEVDGYKVFVFYGVFEGQNCDVFFDDFCFGCFKVFIIINVLVCGIDVFSVFMVINYDILMKGFGVGVLDYEIYFYCIGCIGCFGCVGVFISFVYDR